MVWTIEKRREDVSLGEKNSMDFIWRTLKQNEFFVLQQRIDLPGATYTTAGLDSSKKTTPVDYPYLIQPSIIQNNNCLWCIDDNQKICLLCSKRSYRICTVNQFSLVIAKAKKEKHINTHWEELEKKLSPLLSALAGRADLMNFLISKIRVLLSIQNLKVGFKKLKLENEEREKFENLLKMDVKSDRTEREVLQYIESKYSGNEYFHSIFPNVPLAETLLHCLFFFNIFKFININN